jgi:oligopeptide transport system substrate-binding protein
MTRHWLNSTLLAALALVITAGCGDSSAPAADKPANAGTAASSASDSGDASAIGGEARPAGDAVGVTAARPDDGGKKIFRFINRGDLITLDLNQMSYLQDFRVTYAIREGLYKPDGKTLEPKLNLAESVTQSDDKKVWTFRLRKDGKWSNGDPVTAKDFLFSWRLLLESPGQYSYLLFYVKNAKPYVDSYRDSKGMSFDEVGIKAPDDYTLEVTLNDPLPYLPDLLTFPTFYPRHEKSMAPFKRADEKGRVSYDGAYVQPQNVVTNGAFLLKEWTPGRRVVMEKNPNYRNAAQIKLDGVVMVVNTDPQAAVVQFDKGEVDWLADVNPEYGFERKKQNSRDLWIADAFGTAYLTINCAEKVAELRDTKNPLADLRVRQALAMTIDKNRIVEDITRMGEKPADRYMPTHFYKGWNSSTVPAQDIAKAKQLLAEAGFPDGKGFPVLSIAYNADSVPRRDIAEFLRNQWQRHLKINIELRAMELKGYRDYITTKQYTIALAAWYGDYADASTWTDKYLSTSENNDSNWAPPEFDKLCYDATKEPDEAKRKALLVRAESMINEQLPIIPLYYYVNYTLRRPEVRDLPLNARNTTIWDDVDLELGAK